MLVNLPQQSKDLLQANGFSVSRSDRPASRTAADMTMEQTINKHAKPSGGIVGVSRSQPAYYTWCVTRHNRLTELNTSRQHIRWPTSNKRNVKLIKNLLFPKGNSMKRLSRKLWTHSQLSSTHLTLKESILRAYLQAEKYPRIFQKIF
ncbi:hypothetical protein PoB_002725400 [Plakobranchus ocellatus]|uniref:Uncharacterized protein n=1 Tax=Plakobranchus ocellatus TaxID=259542 RepID=A0AAV4A3H9_9GAST|nr:hypothetical protein PoB_002725400 [Plakobranchus ocellatus]